MPNLLLSLKEAKPRSHGQPVASAAEMYTAGPHLEPSESDFQRWVSEAEEAAFRNEIGLLYFMCRSTLSACVYVQRVHAWRLRKSEEGLGSPGTGGTGGCEPPGGC